LGINGRANKSRSHCKSRAPADSRPASQLGPAARLQWCVSANGKSLPQRWRAIKLKHWPASRVRVVDFGDCNPAMC
jgi:hypothetical protein